MALAAGVLAVVPLIGCQGDGLPGGDAAASGEVLAQTAGACSAPLDAEAMEEEVIRLVNEIREANGLSRVVKDERLCEIARDFACQMVEEDFFAHIHPITGEGPGQRAFAGGYAFRTLGENLAAGQPTPQQAMEDWLNSDEGHRENILSPRWSVIGVAVRTGGEYGLYWVQEFADPF